MAVIISLLRKYDCKHLDNNALSRLAVEYPTTLEGWDANHENHTRIKGDSALDVDVVNTAREHSINTILPAAFLACLELLTFVSLVYFPARFHVFKILNLGKNSLRHQA